MSNPIESDSHAFYHVDQLQANYAEHTVVHDFEDTDVWMILAYVSHQSQQMMFMFKKTRESRNFYNSHKLFSDEDVASIALAVYTFTGVDNVGGLFVCRNFFTMKRTLAANDTSMNEVLERLGENTITDEILLKSLGGFTIKIIYKEFISKNLAEARAHKWRKLRTSDSSHIPPDEESLGRNFLHL